MQANSRRIIDLYIQNEGAKLTEQNTVGFATLEKSFLQSTEQARRADLHAAL